MKKFLITQWLKFKGIKRGDTFFIITYSFHPGSVAGKRLLKIKIDDIDYSLEEGNPIHVFCSVLPGYDNNIFEVDYIPVNFNFPIKYFLKLKKAQPYLFLVFKLNLATQLIKDPSSGIDQVAEHFLLQKPFPWEEWIKESASQSFKESSYYKKNQKK